MTKKDIAELRAWHEARLVDLQYPEPIVKELTYALKNWLAKVKAKD